MVGREWEGDKEFRRGPGGRPGRLGIGSTGSSDRSLGSHCTRVGGVGKTFAPGDYPCPFPPRDLLVSCAFVILMFHHVIVAAGCDELGSQEKEEERFHLPSSFRRFF
jgi:hypothetical protein